MVLTHVMLLISVIVFIHIIVSCCWPLAMRPTVPKATFIEYCFKYQFGKQLHPWLTKQICEGYRCLDWHWWLNWRWWRRQDSGRHRGHRDTGRRWRKEASDHKFRITDSHPDKHCCLTSSSLFTICLQVGWNININDQKCKWEGGRLNRSEWKTDSSFWSQMGWKWIFLAAYHQSYILPCSFCISTDSSATV